MTDREKIVFDLLTDFLHKLTSQTDEQEEAKNIDEHIDDMTHLLALMIALKHEMETENVD